MPILPNTPFHPNSSWLSSSTPDPRALCLRSPSSQEHVCRELFPQATAGPSACSAELSRTWTIAQSLVKTNTTLSEALLFFPAGLFSWLLLWCEREGTTCHCWLPLDSRAKGRVESLVHFYSDIVPCCIDPAPNPPHTHRI